MAWVREKRNAYTDLVRKHSMTIPLGRPKVGVYIKMGLKGVGMDGVNSIHIALDGDTWRDVIHTLLDLQVP
jgi:hypothetical protein